MAVGNQFGGSRGAPEEQQGAITEATTMEAAQAAAGVIAEQVESTKAERTVAAKDAAPPEWIVASTRCSPARADSGQQRVQPRLLQQHRQSQRNRRSGEARVATGG